MPTYAYICAKCGHEFDRFESITSKPNTLCEKCGKKKAERQISGGAGLIFKGSGFYVTDYKANRGGPAKTEGDSKPAETKSTETKSESKSETKSDSKPAATTTPVPSASSSNGDSKSSGAKKKK